MIGNVKWFNNKAGFGFITMGENTDAPKDVFAHYSNINVKNSQYKYLVQGEYVEFDLSATTEGQHEFQATNITGIQGGATLCERRKVSREAAALIDDDDERRAPMPPRSSSDAPRLARRSSNAPSVHRPRPVREKRDDEDEGFQTVQKRRQPSRA